MAAVTLEKRWAPNHPAPGEHPPGIETGVAYFGNRIPGHVAEDLCDIVERGCTYVVHTFSENDWTYYHRTMAEVFDLTRRAGLEVWVDPWGVGHVFGGEAFSRWVAEYPEWCQRDGEGRHIAAACLHQPPFRRFVRAWVDAALALAPDVVLWDEPHLFVGAGPGETRWSCRCPLCCDLYRQCSGESMPVDRRDPGVRAFRAWTVLDFLTDAIGYAHRRGARNAVCLMPDEALPEPGPDWAEVASIPGLENLGTDPYPFPPAPGGSPPWQLDAPDIPVPAPAPPAPVRWRSYVERNARRVARLAAAHGLRNHLWIQAFGLPADDRGYVQGAIELAVEAGITNVATWGYQGTGYCSSLACERPEVVWETIGRAYRTLRQQ